MNCLKEFRKALAIIGFLMFFVTAEPYAQNVSVSVNCTTIVNIISDHLYGCNIAVWDQEVNGTNAAFNDAMTSSGIKYYRWPGGSWADIVMWNGYMSTGVTYAQSLSMLQENGGTMQPICNFSGYWGNTQHTLAQTVQAAADEVTDYNITRKLGAKYWEIGNEEYGKWEQGYTNGVTYGAEYCSFYTAMKAVDSTIKVGAVVTVPREPYSEWVYDLTFSIDALASMKAQKIVPDFLIIHEYPYNEIFDDSVTQQNDTAVTGRYIDLWPSYIDTFNTWVTNAFGASNVGKVQYLVTEFNALPVSEANPGQMLNAMYISQSLMEFARLGVAGASPWLAEYYIGAGDPTWYVYPMFNFNYGTRVVNATITPANTRTRAWAALDSSGNLTMFLANNSLSDSSNATITLQGVTGGASGEKWTMQTSGSGWKPELTAVTINGTASPAQASIKGLSGQKITTGTTFSVSLPAYSMTWLRIPITGGGSSTLPEKQALRPVKPGASINQIGRNEFIVKLLMAAAMNPEWIVSVYNVNGKRIYSKTGNGDATTLALGNAASGVYFCTTTVDGLKLVNMLVVK